MQFTDVMSLQIHLGIMCRCLYNVAFVTRWKIGSEDLLRGLNTKYVIRTSYALRVCHTEANNVFVDNIFFHRAFISSLSGPCRSILTTVIVRFNRIARILIAA